MKARYLLISVVVIFIAGVLTTSSYAKLDPQTCVGMWLFNEGKGDIVKDSSDNKNDGKLTGGSKWVGGKFGKALSFDGVDGIVRISDSPSLSMGTTITVGAWVKPGPSIDGYRNAAAQYKAWTAGASWILRTSQGADGRFTPHVSVANGGFAAIGNCLILSTDEWNHIAFTYDGETLLGYVNGVHEEACQSADPSGKLNDVSGDITIGAADGFEYYNGLIDELVAFNKVLTEQDINSIMNQGSERALGIADVFPSGKLATAWAAIKAR